MVPSGLAKTLLFVKAAPVLAKKVHLHHERIFLKVWREDVQCIEPP